MITMTVSIIIPVYNVSHYIENCMMSVMNQTYDDIECIIVDDATQDDSIDKCYRMIQAYQGPIKFSILHHGKNRGLSAARNTGSEAATGEYIFYLDGDDELTNDCIEKLMRPVIKDSSIEMVTGNYMRRADGCMVGSFERQTLIQQEKDFKSLEAVRNFYFRRLLRQSAWNKLIKRDFLLRYHLSFKEGLLWEDTLWIFFVVKKLSHLYIIPDVTYYYVKRPRSITTGMVKHEELIRHWCLVYEEIAHHFTEEERGREAKFHLKGLCFKCISYSDNSGLRSVAKSYIQVLQTDSYIIDILVFSSVIYLSKFSLARATFRYIARKLI